MMLFYKKHPYWLVCVVSILCVAFYWSLWATDRYVSEAHVVLNSPDVSTSINFSALLSGGSTGKGDLLLLRDHLLSVDMLKKLDETLDLRSHYSNGNIDMWARLGKEVPTEHFHKYYLKRIRVEMDDYAGVLRIRSQAYDPDMANAITGMLLREGEQHMNQMGQRLAEEQVRFIEVQVDQLAERLHIAREAVLEYQNENGLVSPSGTVESLSAVVANLEAELAKLNARRSALSDFQSTRSPEMVRINSEIAALRKQIGAEQSRMATSSGNALNSITAQYETLQMQAEFALNLYSNALIALENTRVEAIRKLKQISVLQTPTMPEYSVEPKRLYNTTVFAILAILAALITQLIIAIVRDHRD
ncbi:chain-length determining protein [Zobellella sp. DQSA1]|uniref:chain-length determining protein n=1 Tax=Zobellella sp. DQSA1 TaxID=3342386 RepID=UPI0035BF9368